MNNKKVFLNEKIAKKLFKNEKYGKILSARVISDIIGADYEEVYNNLKLSTDEIAFSSLTVNSTADAIYYDDVTFFDIELNFYNSESKKRQLESYVYQLYLGQIHTYHGYNNLKKVVQISIDTFDRFQKNEFLYKVILMEENYHIPYNDLIQFIHINIDYLRKLDYTDIETCGNKLMKDLYFLTCNDDKKLNYVYEGDNLMEEIINEAKEIAGIEKMNLYLTDEELIKEDQEFYYKKGIKEGIKEMILNLYNSGISIDFIAKTANLKEKEVKAIINEIGDTMEKMNLYLTDEELIKEDQEFYYKKGKKEGIEQRTREMILNMYKNKISLDMISKCTQVPLDELNKIIKGEK